MTVPANLEIDKREIEKTFNCDGLKPLLSNVDSHIDRLIKILEERYAVIFDARLALKTRLVVRSPPLELGVPWDQQWNLPYIPATVLRDALQFATKQIITKCFGTIGTLEEQSSVAVLDAYPIQCPYGSSLLTADYVEADGVSELDEPEKLPIITVSSGTVFRIVVLRAKRALSCTEEELFKELYRLVKIALKRGIGALTTLGYGTFDVNSI
jgi:CRISPR/Cas system CMR subunit Cmr6 (Cas7 group RAMP superfamily)